MSAGSGSHIFKIAITGDFVASDGSLYFDAEALQKLNALPDTEIDILRGDVGAPIGRDVLRTYDAILTKRSPVPEDCLCDTDLRTIHISRNGVGLEHLDLAACSRAGIIVTNTPESVRRPMASSAMALILALAHRIVEKDHATRAGRWVDRHLYKGTALAGRTLGVIGAGNIGADLLRLAAPWNMTHLVAHPSLSPERAEALGAEKVPLRELVARADFIVLCCPLTEATRDMINAETLSLMRPSAFLVNIARGDLIDEPALIAALQEGRIAGAALDVFAPEPPFPDNPLFKLKNTIVTSHNVGFSDEGNRLGNIFAAETIAKVLQGRIPQNIANGEALKHPRLKHLRM